MMNSINGYHIESLLAKGGMASIYLAKQVSLKRQVVLKILNPRLDEKIRIRFIDEGQIIAQLKHPNIVTVYDVGKECVKSTEYNFLVMEFLEGGDLEGAIATGMDTYSALDMIDKIADALHLVHQQGIIHADVKPANILYRSNACPVLTDFGISRRKDDNQKISQPGTLYVSPFYASPELIQGHEYDQRTDIYSLGIMMYEMLVGKKPYSGKTELDIIANSISKPIPQLPDALKALQPLLKGMLAKKKQDRIADTRVVSQYIRQFIKDNNSHNLTSLNKTKLIDSDNVVEYVNKRNQLTGYKYYSAFLFIALILLVSMSTWYLKASTATTRSNKNLLASIEPVIDTVSANFDNNEENQTESIDNLLVNEVKNEVKNDVDLINLQAVKARERIKEEKRLQLEKELKQQAVEKLLIKADDSFKKYHLTMPINDNALYYYQKILENEPKNKKALTGIKRIVQRYEAMAHRELDKYHYQKAQKYIYRGLSIEPDNKRLLELQQQANIVYEPKRVINKVKNFFKTL